MAQFIFKSKSAFEVADGIYGEVRTMKAPLRARLSWQDNEWPKPSYVQILVAAKPNKKSILVFQHDGLNSAQLKEQMRTHWQAALARLLAIADC